MQADTKTAAIDGIEEWATQLEERAPADVLSWAAERFAPRVAMATGFGAEGCVLIHLIADHELPIDLFTLDTGLLFAETYELWERLECRYGVRIRGIEPALSLDDQASRFGDALWSRDPDRCCALRKVAPLESALSGVDAWITAIRRQQTSQRLAARAVEHDARHDVVKVNPLVRWTEHDVWSFISTHDIPYNRLHHTGYPSIGCHPCTTPVVEGEDPRAGRWRGREKTECGLHAGGGAEPQFVALTRQGA